MIYTQVGRFFYLLDRNFFYFQNISKRYSYRIHIILLYSVGEILATEKAFISHLEFEFCFTHCSNCFIRTESLIPCNGCSTVSPNLWILDIRFVIIIFNVVIVETIFMERLSGQHLRKKIFFNFLAINYLKLIEINLRNDRFFRFRQLEKKFDRFIKCFQKKNSPKFRFPRFFFPFFHSILLVYIHDI